MGEDKWERCNNKETQSLTRNLVVTYFSTFAVCDTKTVQLCK